jgi:hypothetical protein
MSQERVPTRGSWDTPGRTTACSRQGKLETLGLGESS